MCTFKTPLCPYPVNDIDKETAGEILRKVCIETTKAFEEFSKAFLEVERKMNAAK